MWYVYMYHACHLIIDNIIMCKDQMENLQIIDMLKYPQKVFTFS
jgi:hypothetical protein